MRLLMQLAVLPFALPVTVLLLLSGLLLTARVVEAHQSRVNRPRTRSVRLIVERTTTRATRRIRDRR